jgi:hypothetical protein
MSRVVTWFGDTLDTGRGLAELIVAFFVIGCLVTTIILLATDSMNPIWPTINTILIGGFFSIEALTLIILCMCGRELKKWGDK